MTLSALQCKPHTVLNAVLLGSFSSLLVGASAFGFSYSASLDVSKFGYLLQNDTQCGSVSCGPTSATNGLVFLQNSNLQTYSSSLAGTTYSEWKATANNLITNYMSTMAGGTSLSNYTYGLTNYFGDVAPGTTEFTGQALNSVVGWNTTQPKPSFFEDGNPTGNFFYSSLTKGSAIGISIFYAGGEGGHALTLTGINWNDINNDGFISKDENATIDIIDPLDPGNIEAVINPKQAGAKEGHIYQNSLDSPIYLDYSQRALDGGMVVNGDVTGATISFAMAATPVPVPPQAMGVAVVLAGQVVRRLRRGSKQSC
jgi:hypothetical protein